jgi:Ca-activated chloride channel family protein
MTFRDPWILALLPFALALVWWGRTRRGARPTLRFSSVARMRRVRPPKWAFLRRSPLWLRLAAVGLTVMALARPQTGQKQVRYSTEGVAIEMVVDRSSSMSAQIEFEGQKMNRLEAVKQVFRDFVLGDGKRFKGRPHDLVGLVTFAGYADTICPLVQSHGALLEFLKTVKLARPGSEEDGTALGDALALAAARLRTAESELQSRGGKAGYDIKSKVVILLTDGVSNRGERSPEEAAELCRKWGIKVYPIGIGGESFRRIRTFFGDQLIRVPENFDEETLEDIARATGGKYNKAGTGDSLKATVAAVDALERTKIESLEYLEYDEEFAAFGMAALGCLALEALLASTVFRKAP